MKSEQVRERERETKKMEATVWPQATVAMKECRSRVVRFSPLSKESRNTSFQVKFPQLLNVS